MEEKHTPGPWTYMEHQHEEEQGYFLVKADCQKRPLVTFVADEANARLIASAPDLLEALQKLLRGWETHGGFVNNEIGKARAAIAKAMGSQS